MVIHNQKTVDPSVPGKEKKPAEAAGSDDTCRCKETSKKTVPELFRLMISDLAFWRKTKKW